MNRNKGRWRKRGWTDGRLVLIGTSLCALLTLVVCSVPAQNKNKGQGGDGLTVTIQGKDTDAGLAISGQATAKEVGLPLYPGARLHRDDKDDSPSVKLGLWGGLFGFKVVVLKLESSDSREKVAAFYQKALAKYGKVLDCTNNPPGHDDQDKKGHTLTCQDDRPDSGGLLFKAGTKEKQHIVGIKPNGTGCLFQLVYLIAHGDEDKEPS
ncbi:MAG TPA: hypothetical protein VJN42_10375 [Candidatus Acidoferrum sp.]|nr:hypothetical protein [Candidatus Acidoferrum sp.]